MLFTTKRDARRALKAVAKQEGISLDKIRSEIMCAINEAMQSEDTAIQSRWENIPHKGKAPTPEEFITYVVNHLEELRDSSNS